MRIDSTSRHPRRDVAECVSMEIIQLHSSTATQRSEIKLELGPYYWSKFLLTRCEVMKSDKQTSHFTPWGRKVEIWRLIVYVSAE